MTASFELELTLKGEKSDIKNMLEVFFITILPVIENHTFLMLS